MLLWNENFTHGKVGGAALVKAQQTPATLSGGRTIAYAAGLAIGMVGGLREVAHSGSTGGYRTWLGRYPDQAVSVAVLCNSAQANPTALGRETARLWTGGAASKAPATNFTADPAKVAALAGLYRKVRDNTVLRVKWQEGQLQTRGPLVAIGPGKFLSGETEVQFEDGHMRMTTPNGEVAYERVEPVQPSAAELTAFSGEYESHETETILKIAPGVKAGELSYQIGMQKTRGIEADVS